MASFDVQALFTNIPLDETIDICVRNLFKKPGTKIKDLNSKQFRDLLELACKESLFIFDGACYKQIDGVAMGSPLGPTLANIFLCYHEENWIDNCPIQFKPKYYKRYVDDIFLLFNDANHVNKFEKYLNSRHKNMKFTKEVESENSLAFLDIRIIRESGNFLTSIYRKPTFSGVYLNFRSFAPDIYKRGLVNCLLFRIYKLCSNWSIIHDEISQIRKILLKNKYPLNFIDKCIQKFLEHCFVKKGTNEVATDDSTKEEFTVLLPFLGNQSNIVKKKLSQLFSDFCPKSKLKIVFKSGIKIWDFFKFKDSIPSHIRSLVVYKFSCSSCNATYIGKTERHHKVRMCEHLGISYKTGKPMKYHPNSSTAVKDHLRESGHFNNFDNFEILCFAKNNFECLIKESVLIRKCQPNLNKQVKEFKLKLF